MSIPNEIMLPGTILGKPLYLSIMTQLSGNHPNHCNICASYEKNKTAFVHPCSLNSASPLPHTSVPQTSMTSLANPCLRLWCNSNPLKGCLYNPSVPYGELIAYCTINFIPSLFYTSARSMIFERKDGDKKNKWQSAGGV